MSPWRSSDDRAVLREGRSAGAAPGARLSEIRELAADAQRRDPGPQLPASRGPGRGRLRRRLARPLASRPPPRTRDVIVFCGVHFMAETAAILSPERTVLIPDLRAGCSLADSITAEQLRAWKAREPGRDRGRRTSTPRPRSRPRSDYCCTSGNAAAVIEAIPADREILFLPDMFLGLWLERVTGRKLKIWLGECHVHAGIRPDDIDRAGRTPRPMPSCSSTPSAAAPASAWRSRNDEHAHPLDRGHGQLRPADAASSATSSSRPRPGSSTACARRCRTKSFDAASARAVCRYMKMITLEKLRDSLRDMQLVVDGAAGRSQNGHGWRSSGWSRSPEGNACRERGPLCLLPRQQTQRPCSQSDGVSKG